jgi:hypothetical protein
MSYADRIRAGEVSPWVGDVDELEGARRSAAIAAEEIATLAPYELERHEALILTRQAWLDRAALLEELAA